MPVVSNVCKDKLNNFEYTEPLMAPIHDFKGPFVKIGGKWPQENMTLFFFKKRKKNGRKKLYLQTVNAESVTLAFIILIKVSL